MYKVKDVQFVISAVKPAQFPNTPYPEIAFVGRSNVGKSSLLNSLVSRKNLARISSTPGKTRHINFFQVNGKFNLVDLPGYGYAKVSKVERESWRKIIEAYLVEREQLKLVVSLIDIRHDPTALDLDLINWLESIEREYLIVLTKGDKVKKGEVDARMEQVSEMFYEHQYLRGILSYSVKSSEAREGVWNTLELFLR